MGRTPGNASDPIAGSGAQQTRNIDVEETTEGVRNPEGGTGFDGSHRRTEGSASFREWTHRRSNGRGATAANPKRGGIPTSSEVARSSGRDESALNERRRSRRWISTETETARKRRPPDRRGWKTREDLEDPAGNGQGRGGGGKGDTTRYHVVHRGQRSAPPVRPLRRLEDPSNSTRAARSASADRNHVPAEPSVGTLPRRLRGCCPLNGAPRIIAMSSVKARFHRHASFSSCVRAARIVCVQARREQALHLR
jgi:hypothetical protein